MNKIVALIRAYFWGKTTVESILGNFTKTLRELDVLVAERNEQIKCCCDARAKLNEEQAKATADLRRAMSVRSNIEQLIEEN